MPLTKQILKVNVYWFNLKEEETISIEALKKQLVDSEKEKKALLKLALHDFRSPMNKLFALVGLFKMSDKPLTDEQVGYLDKMELVIRDGLSQMRNLMDLKAIEEADTNTEVLIEHIHVGKLVQKVVREYTPDAARKNIVLSFTEKNLSLSTDRISCLRILDQLISNAIKFTPKRGEILIELEARDEDVLVLITDGGRGIAEEEIPSLFQKFTPLSTRATGGESSTGIGLFIAWSMARKIGGNISYTNNNKSVFTLHLPKVSLA
jgi:signal transduction histidine kinase